MAPNETIGHMQEIREWFANLFEFLWVIINEWAILATGGIVVALVWLWSVMAGMSISKRTSINIALVFLFLACFHAWREQYRSRLALLVEQQRQNQRMGQLTWISAFISDGQALLLINPGEEATEQDIKEWKFKVDQWVARSWISCGLSEKLNSMI